MWNSPCRSACLASGSSEALSECQTAVRWLCPHFGHLMSSVSLRDTERLSLKLHQAFIYWHLVTLTSGPTVSFRRSAQRAPRAQRSRLQAVLGGRFRLQILLAKVVTWLQPQTLVHPPRFRFEVPIFAIGQVKMAEPSRPSLRQV